MPFGMMDEVRLVMKLDRRSRAPEVAVKEFLKLAGAQKIVGWYEFPNSLLLFSLNPGNPESGTIHIYDRRRGRLFVVDFKDTRFGGYSEADFRKLIRECHFLELAAQPALLEKPDMVAQTWLLKAPTEVHWFVEPGSRPVPMVVTKSSPALGTSLMQPATQDGRPETAAATAA